MQLELISTAAVHFDELYVVGYFIDHLIAGFFGVKATFLTLPKDHKDGFSIWIYPNYKDLIRVNANSFCSQNYGEIILYTIHRGFSYFNLSLGNSQQLILEIEKKPYQSTTVNITGNLDRFDINALYQKTQSNLHFQLPLKEVILVN